MRILGGDRTGYGQDFRSVCVNPTESHQPDQKDNLPRFFHKVSFTPGITTSPTGIRQRKIFGQHRSDQFLELIQGLL